MRVQSSFLVSLCKLEYNSVTSSLGDDEEDFTSREFTSRPRTFLFLSLKRKSVAQAVVNDYLGQFWVGRFDWSKSCFVLLPWAANKG